MGLPVSFPSNGFNRSCAFSHTARNDLPLARPRASGACGAKRQEPSVIGGELIRVEASWRIWPSSSVRTLPPLPVGTPRQMPAGQSLLNQFCPSYIGD